MIYTSYFAKLKELQNQNITPISICDKSPDLYDGLEYKKLAPKYNFFMKLKRNYDNDYYAEWFQREVLNKLNAREVIMDLSRMDYGFNVGENNIALICYEKPSDFCHRHLVSNWLSKNGFKCEEW